MTRIGRRVAEMDAQGYTVAQIARHLHISQDRVDQLLISHYTRTGTR